VPSEATGLGDLAALGGFDEIEPATYRAAIHEFVLYESSHKINGRVRGEIVNAGSRVITDGELKFKVTVQFAEGCEREIRGEKSLRSLKVTDAKPWRPGETLGFTITSDEELTAVTGEFEAESLTWELYAFVEDPLCHQARGVLLDLPGAWTAATVGAPVTGSAITNRKVRLTSAPDGGSRLDTVEEGTTVSVNQVKGRGLRVRTPGGTEGWLGSDDVDLLDAESLFR